MPAREFTYSVGDGAAREVRRAIEPDMAAAIDKPWEIMAEDFGIPLATARKISDWHERQMTQADEEMKVRIQAAERSSSVMADRLQRVVATLIQPSDNLRAKIWGLALSYGLATRLNGVRNGTDISVQLGCTRALISHYKRGWDRILGSNVQIFGKTPAACERMRVARNAFVMKQKGQA